MSPLDQYASSQLRSQGIYIWNDWLAGVHDTRFVTTMTKIKVRCSYCKFFAISAWFFANHNMLAVFFANSKSSVTFLAASSFILHGLIDGSLRKGGGSRNTSPHVASVFQDSGPAGPACSGTGRKGNTVEEVPSNVEEKAGEHAMSETSVFSLW